MGSTSTSEAFQPLASPKGMTAENDNKPKPSCCTKLVIGIVLIVIGAIFFITGLIFGTYLPSSIDNQIFQGATTCNAGELKDSFKEPYGDCETCVPYYLDYNPFNVVNAAEVIADPSTKLRVEEKGPYTYRKMQKKIEISFTGDVISYKSYSNWLFQEDMSCETCKETDLITKLDMGYVAVMAKAGGENAFAEKLIEGILKDPALANMAKGMEPLKQGLMRALTGLNSLNPEAMLTSVNAMIPLFAATAATNNSLPDPVAILEAAGQFSITMAQTANEVAHSGVFSTRTVKQFAMGYPGVIAGFASLSVKPDCMRLGEICTECDLANPSEECKLNWKVCSGCKTADRVIAATVPLCDGLEAYLTNALNVQEAKKITLATCRQCTQEGEYRFCLAPMPGAVESTGIDHNVVPLNPEMLYTTSQKTGCDDIENIGEYTVLDSVKEQVMWNKAAPEDRAPFTGELQKFSAMNYCGDKPANDVYCQKVSGGDGASFPPAGADLSGLKTSLTFKDRLLYISQARQDVNVTDTGERVTIKGVELHRLRPSEDLLTKTDENKGKGTGNPVNGVQSLAYSTGFLAYVSFPFYLFGDKSLTTNIDLYFSDGVQANEASMMTDGKVNKEIYDRYTTVIDVEPATGKTMNARKCLMASYAVAAKEDGTSSTDLLLKTFQSGVIVPAFWAEERVTVTSTLANKFSFVDSLSNSMLPVLIIGLVVGLILIAFGVFMILKHKREMRC